MSAVLLTYVMAAIRIYAGGDVTFRPRWSMSFSTAMASICMAARHFGMLDNGIIIVDDSDLVSNNHEIAACMPNNHAAAQCTLATSAWH